MRKLIIWADDDQNFMEKEIPSFNKAGFDIIACHTIAEAAKQVIKGASEYLLLDIDFPGNPKEGMVFLEAIKEINPHLRVVLFTGYPVLGDSVRSVKKLMASDYIAKPIPEHEGMRKAFFEELHTSFNEDIFRSELIRVINGKNTTKLEKLRAALEIKDLDAFFGVVKSFFADLSYNIKTTESYYHGYMQLLLDAAGIDIISEKETNIGRIDLVAKTVRYLYLMEFKLSLSLTAIDQIKERLYYQPYYADSRQIILVGVAFDNHVKNVSEYQWEEYHR